MAVDAMFRSPSACFTIAKWTLAATRANPSACLRPDGADPLAGRAIRNGLEHTKELRAVNPSALLRRENEIAGVGSHHFALVGLGE